MVLLLLQQHHLVLKLKTIAQFQLCVKLAMAGTFWKWYQLDRA